MVNTNLTAAPGIYELDPVHSTAGFMVRHKVSQFRGEFTDLHATLVVTPSGELELHGTAVVASLTVKSGSMSADFLSPNFFDADRYPQISFRSSEITLGEGDAITVIGDLGMRGHAKRVTANGTAHAIDDDGHGRRLVGIDLEAVIDRTEFGISFVQQLPGGGVAVGTDVRLNVELEFFAV